MSKRMRDCITFIPFGVAISAFIIYLRYALTIKFHEKIAVTSLMLTYASRFRSIAIFSCVIGIITLLITSLIYYYTNNKEVYKPTYKDIKLALLKLKTNFTKAINIIAILLCIVLILLLGLQINKQSNINKEKMNIKTVELFD